MMAATQYPLALMPKASLLPDDFIITDCNQTMTATLKQLPDTATPIVVVLGAKGSGKSHMLEWLAAQRTLHRIDASGIGDAPTERWMNEAGACYAVDDAHHVASQAALAQAINHARATGCGLLLMMDSGFVPTSPDLASRLNAAHRLHMPAPDDDLQRALLLKRFADLQWRCDVGVIDFVVARSPRDMASLHQFVALADREGLVQKRALTIPFATHILNMMEHPHVS